MPKKSPTPELRLQRLQRAADTLLQKMEDLMAAEDLSPTAFKSLSSTLKDLRDIQKAAKDAPPEITIRIEGGEDTWTT